MTHADGTVETVAIPNGGDVTSVRLASGVALALAAIPATAPRTVGTAGDDNLIGTSGHDLIDALAANDVVQGGNGNDRIHGNAGHDTLYGQAGDDSLFGGTGNDYLIGGAGGDYLDGGAGTDWAQYNQATAAVQADLGNSGNNSGEAAGDTYVSIENLYGSTYNDTLRGDAAGNALWGNAGNDRIFGLGGNDVIMGEAGHDSLVGGAGHDSLDGGAGNDTLQGDGGNDTLRGGAGIDTVVYAGTTSVRVNLGQTAAQDTGLGVDLLSDIENLSSGSGNDTLFGNALVNTLNGGAGNDSIVAGAGNDVLIGGLGNDTLDGGVGNDTAQYTGAAAIQVNLGYTTAQVTGQGTDLLLNIESVTTGSGNDTLFGNAGANTLNGGGGSDSIVAGSGNDVLIGGLGNDTLDGGIGVDTANFGGTAAIRVNLGLTTAQNTGHGTDLLLNIENVVSGSGNDTLLGNALANNLNGGAGNDSLVGGGGNDVLVGGMGDDTMDGGAGSDTASFGGSGNIQVNLGYTTAQNTGQGMDLLLNIENVVTGSGNDTILGNAEANNLNGGAGNDSIVAGAGNDVLIGGLGNDTMTGGPGADTFIYRKDFDQDTVMDFQDGVDKIRVLDFAGVNNFTQASTYASQSGAHVVFDFGGGDTLTVRNTTLAALADDMIFV